MEQKKPEMSYFTKDKRFCVKCGSEIPYDDVGHKCELIECPKPKKK